MTDATPGDAPAPAPAAPNKAQEEFDKYARRRDAQASGGGGPFPGDGLSWNVPLGVGMVNLGGPQANRAVRDVEHAAGSVAEGLGTTVRLGVDLLNAALFSGVKILGGFTGAYGGQHPQGCGCDSCCEPDCCEPSCCECDCCNPGVGSCC